jgi:hypothetical protein
VFRLISMWSPMSCMERLGGEEDEHPELGRHHRLVRTGSAVRPRRQLLPQQVEQLVQVGRRAVTGPGGHRRGRPASSLGGPPEVVA